VVAKPLTPCDAATEGQIENESVPKIIFLNVHNKFIFLKLQSEIWLFQIKQFPRAV